MPQLQCPKCGHCGPRYDETLPRSERPHSAHDDGTQCVCGHITCQSEREARRAGGRYWSGKRWVCFGGCE